MDSECSKGKWELMASEQGGGWSVSGRFLGGDFKGRDKSWENRPNRSTGLEVVVGFSGTPGHNWKKRQEVRDEV